VPHLEVLEEVSMEILSGYLMVYFLLVFSNGRIRFYGTAIGAALLLHGVIQ